MPKLVADNVKINPDTGELEFAFEEPAPAAVPAPPADPAAVQNFALTPEQAMERYKSVQGWATKVHQENLANGKRLAQLEAALRQQQTAPPPTLPTAVAPGVPDLEKIQADPQGFEAYVQQAIDARLGMVGEYVDKKLEPFNPVLGAYNMHNELRTAVAAHPDFVQWQPEMLQISNSLPPGQDMSLEELYYEAQRTHPEKVQTLMQAPTASPQPVLPQQPGQPQALPAAPVSPQVAPVPGTPQAPGTPLVPAQPVVPPYDPSAPVHPTPMAQPVTATVEEVRQLAARQQTETGVTGAVEPTIHGLDAAMDAAWTEVTSST